MPEMDRWKMIYGYTLLLVLTVLAGAIALGKVHQESSYGLESVLGPLAVLAGHWANWAFGQKKE